MAKLLTPAACTRFATSCCLRSAIAQSHVSYPQETLPKGMRVKSIASGHAKLVFQGYYTAVLTLAEAPEVQADPSPQPEQPLQAGPNPGQPQQVGSNPGPPQQQSGQPQHAGPNPGPPHQQPGHPQQGQPGPAEPMAVDDHQADEVTSGSMKVVSQDDKVGPHKEKYRWRLLSFEILPGGSWVLSHPLVLSQPLVTLASTVHQASIHQSIYYEYCWCSSGESTGNSNCCMCLLVGGLATQLVLRSAWEA